MGKATQDLKKEHDSILHVLKILDKIMAAEAKEDLVKFRYYSELIYFLQIFADKCHHGKEENYLFEELVQKGVRKEGGPIGVLLQEHMQAREYIAQMNKSLQERELAKCQLLAAKYRDLLRSHIEKENNVLFVMADNLLNETEQNDMFEKFENHEESVIGHGVHEKLHAMIQRWAAEFEVQ